MSSIKTVAHCGADGYQRSNNAAAVDKIRMAEATTCIGQGGFVSYGPMFRMGCSRGALQGAVQDGYNTCWPTAAGGVCCLK